MPGTFADLLFIHVRIPHFIADLADRCHHRNFKRRDMQLRPLHLNRQTSLFDTDIQLRHIEAEQAQKSEVIIFQVRSPAAQIGELIFRYPQISQGIQLLTDFSCIRRQIFIGTAAEFPDTLSIR